MEDTAKYKIMGKGPFIKLALMTAMPIMMQNLISTLVSSADTIMLGYVSQDAMSASSLANQLLNILMMAMYGLGIGASVLASQYFAKKDMLTIEKVLGLALRISMSLAIVAFIVAFAFPGAIMRIFTNEQGIIDEGIKYLRITSFTYLMQGFSQIYLSVLRSTDRLVLPTVTYVISLMVNVSLNATFIFGLFGAPKLGLVGVAIGTVVARLAECGICLVHSFVNKDIKLKIKYIFADVGVLLKDFLGVSVPSIVNDVAWSAACAVYSIIMGHLGSDAVAANAVAVMAVNIGAIVCRGFSNATTIIISRELGNNNKPAAKKYSIWMMWISFITAAAGGVVIYLLRPVFLNMYDGKLTDGALEILNVMFLMQIIRLIGEAVNTCMICGCFRGGGDAKFGMKIDMFFMWCVAVPLMDIAAFVIKLPVIWVYLVMCLDEYYKMPPTLVHYLKFNWMTNITRDSSELAESDK